MRQIPSEGEYCTGCPCHHPRYCSYYQEFCDDKRLPQCKKDRPKVMTEEERQILELKGFQKGIAQAATNIYTPKEDIENEL